PKIGVVVHRRLASRGRLSRWCWLVPALYSCRCATGPASRRILQKSAARARPLGILSVGCTCSLTQGPTMRFGLYAEMQTPLGHPHPEMYRDLMRQMEHADQVGFDVYSLIEHHFFQEFSISANPLALICAVAQKTQRIRFRVALHTLP